MAQIPVKGRDGKPVRYAYLDGGDLKLEFEYYARDENECDYQVIQTVSWEEFATIANKFGLDPSDDILSIIEQISAANRGDDLVDALDDNEIKNELFTWMS